MFTRIHHVGIAVSDMEAALSLYGATAGAALLEREPSRDGTMEIAMLRLEEEGGGGLIELLSSRRADSAIGKFLERRGEGLHHLAFEVEDIEAALVRLKEEGYRLVDESPRPGAMNSRIAFLHPKGTGGALWELVEEAKERDS